MYIHIYIYIYTRCGETGNPRVFAAWLDEHMNGRLAAVCRGASQLTFDRSVLGTFRLAYGLSSKKRRAL